ncbi:pleckstrin homology domain-containing family O member 2 [Sceloporus undulatus]|uniref:pleckstrin homology domain-containing family O member 2 n=1 Tax=Sceloporus undulatus TaxID=8520 RepID=UPI001C4AD80C|nr:pleckstrin homology domain-containing family O member 2 [Sceloporus undulatus]
MEDGVKEESAEKPKCPAKADKAGWIKKSSGGLLSLWKERYIQLCKSQLLIYENEEEQKCVETVELERYDRCQDLRALLKRKHRFILIRAPGYKVQDIKFQASNGEEKESWMKALNEGINRGKNRIFDEVKVDESLSLEHVTRRRAKLAHARRPPTRSHLKEVASAMSDGILRLDLDVPDSGPPNITLVTGEADGISLPKETLKPPMPPTKSPKLPSKNPNADSTPEDLELKKPPMPPAKPLKEAGAANENTNSVEEEEKEEEDVAVAAEDVDDSQGRPKKPPVPPAKPHKEIAAPNENINSTEEEEEVEDVAVTGEDAEESKAGFKKPPVPPAKPLKQVVALTENLDSVEEKEEEREEEEKCVAVTGEDVEESGVAPSGESLMETDTNAPTAPALPLKVLSDKMKVTWDSPASEQQGVDCENPLTSSSKEDLPEIGKDVVQPPTPPPKILLGGIQDSMKSRCSSSEADASKGDHQGGGLKPPVNGFDDEGMTESIFHNGEEHLSLQKPQQPSAEPGANEKCLGLPSNDQAHLSEAVRSSQITKPRCASLENLLSGSSKVSLQVLDPQCGAALHVAHMEKKVACEKERTEKLLQKVLQRGLEQAQEGNGPPLNAETLLNEAAAQLQQATQVLQEIRDLGELKKEPAKKGGPKDLVTLYRRSAP